MLYCFLDTNIFIECKLFTEINWHKDIDWLDGLDTSEICLVVAPVVIEELDNFKTDPRSDRRRKRSRIVLNLLEKLSQDTFIREKTYLQLLLEMPVTQKVNEMGLELKNDNKLIASLRLFSEQYLDSKSEIVLMAYDTGVRLKAPNHGIRAIAPPENILREDEPDPVQIELKEAQRKLAKYEAAQPKLDIGFLQEDGSFARLVEFAIDFTVGGFSDEEIGQAIEQKRQELQYTGVVSEFDKERLPSNFDIETLSHLTIKERFAHKELLEVPRDIFEAYNRDVEDYLAKQYIPYLEALSLHQRLSNATKKLHVCVQNKGTAPAHDIKVWLYSPDGVSLSRQLTYEPQPPVSPSKPHTIHQLILPEREIPLSRMIGREKPIPTRNYGRASVPTEPKIRRANSFVVSDEKSSLIHNRDWEWSPIYITLEKPSVLPTAINIPYKITVSNIPEPIPGNLVIKLN